MPLRHAVILCLAILAVPAWAEELSPSRPAGAMALLVRNPDTSGGQPPYALADQYGRIQRLVEPTPGVSLAKHVGARVRIKHDTGRTLLASQLDLPGVALADDGPDLRRVSPAQFVPPRRAQPIDDAPVGREYVVIPTQLSEDVDAEPIDLDAIIADEGGDSLPEPIRGDRLEPIPADDYYPEAVSGEPINSGHDPDCPHCREQARKGARSYHDHATCPECAVVRGGTCGDGWCGPSCSPASRRGFYGRAEYLLWWFDGMGTPPLVTTNDQGNAPILGNPGTRIVYQGELLDDARSGLRLTLGGWLDDCRDIAIEGDLLFFESQSDLYSYNDPTGLGVLGRPFYNIAIVDNQDNVVGPGEDVQLISYNGQAGGYLNINSLSKFRSGGLRLRTGVCCRDVGGAGGPCDCASCVSGVSLGRRGGGSAISRIDFIAGYRFAELEERLAFNELVFDQPTTIGSVGVNERFDTDNEFHGVDLGFVYDYQSCRWGLELTSKIAVGATHQRATIAGSNTVTVGGASVTTPGGLYAQTSNIGSYERDRFSVLPELSAKLSYRVTPRVRVSAGYSLLYWANVARPGDLIDTSVDGRLASGALTTPTLGSHPRFDWEETSLWAHGFDFGVDFQY